MTIGRVRRGRVMPFIATIVGSLLKLRAGGYVQLRAGGRILLR
jgi:hypothetical protein